MKSDNPDRPLYVELPIRIKTYDIDFVGHVNNIVYIRWLEDLRLHLLDVYLPLENLRTQNIVPIIVGTDIQYRKGIYLDDQHVLGQMWIDDLARATFYLTAQFAVDGDVRCTARQKGTFVDTNKMRPIRIPDALRRRYEAI